MYQENSVSVIWKIRNENFEKVPSAKFKFLHLYPIHKYIHETDILNLKDAEKYSYSLYLKYF